jgi:hypothetical protein
LLAAIKTSTLDPVKTQILANPELGTDFHRCVSLFKDFIKQSATSQIALDATISKLSNISLRGADHDDNEMHGGGSAVIEDRYYSKAEYGKMSQGDKKLLWDRHQKRGGHDGQEKERPLKQSMTMTVASLNRKVAALEKKLASKDEDESANDDESVDQDKPSSGGGNRTNRALLCIHPRVASPPCK